VTLQRPPPEILTLDKAFLDCSKTMISSGGKKSKRRFAAKMPAAPAPITATEYFFFFYFSQVSTSLFFKLKLFCDAMLILSLLK
jgi:hypothetical protein